MNMLTIPAGVVNALAPQQPQQAAPFVWGSGGRRMTPDEIARERALAARQMQADYSPIASPWQGLARVADNLTGALRDREARKASEQNTAEGAEIARLLMTPPTMDASAVSQGGGIVPVDVPPSMVAPDQGMLVPGSASGPVGPVAGSSIDGPPPISEAPAPPSDWRQAVNADPVAAALVGQSETENQIARALSARPKPATVVAPMYRPRDAIIAALTNPYVDQNVRAVADRMWQQEYEQSKPQFFMSNDDRVVYNPATGESQMLYDAPEDFQLYADQMGLEPGTAEYNDAMADYVLRTSGPTANAGRQALENLRQDNRLDMEGVRQKNRMQLRSTPTYAQANPRPTMGRPGGGARPQTLAGVIAPILAKVAQGQPLSAGEQQALNTYYRRTGGNPGGGGAAGASGGQVIRNPRTGERMMNQGGKWVPVK